jgi:hypothetical protein
MQCRSRQDTRTTLQGETAAYRLQLLSWVTGLNLRSEERALTLIEGMANDERLEFGTRLDAWRTLNDPRSLEPP